MLHSSNYVLSLQQKIQIFDYWPEISVCYEIDEFDKDDNIRCAVAACNGLLRPIDSKAELVLVSNALLNDEDIDPKQIVVSNGMDLVKQQSSITLNPGKWLTDEIISYYLKVALTQRDYHLCQQDRNRKRNHFFNSFFMLKLLDEKMMSILILEGSKVPWKRYLQTETHIYPVEH